MIERARADGPRHHDADGAERFDRVLQFFRSSFWILQSDNRGEAQSAVALGATFGYPGVVRARYRRRESGVLQTVDRHQYIRVDHLKVDAFEIEIRQTARHVA